MLHVPPSYPSITHADTPHNNSKPIFWVANLKRMPGVATEMHLFADCSSHYQSQGLGLSMGHCGGLNDAESKQLQTSSLLTKVYRVQVPPPVSRVHISHPLFGYSSQTKAQCHICSSVCLSVRLSVPLEAFARSYLAIPIWVKIEQ